MSEISVIIPCFNSYKYAKKCLKSLEIQTYKNFEVIIVDDCSNDDSYSSFVKYAETSRLNIRVIKSEMNCGPGASREKGLRHSVGNWVCFCDCDDWYSASFLEKMYDLAIKHESDCVLCDYNKVFDNGNEESTGYLKGLANPPAKEDIIACSKESMCIMIVKKQILDTIDMPHLYHSEDAAILPTILSLSNIISIIDEPLYNYYVRNNSASNTVTQETYENAVFVFSVIENKIGNDYKDACEFIGIKTIIYAAVLGAVKAKIPYIEYISEVKNFEKKYPRWLKNKYIKTLGKEKIVFVLCVKFRIIGMVKLFAYLHTKYMER